MDTDYYIKDSKIREILEILRPPVKRNYNNSYQDYIGYVISDSDRRKKTNIDQNKFNIKPSQRAEKSSLSLILQKICKKQILEEYPFSTKTSQEENQPKETNPKIKPTIKVTVIPKRDPNLYEFLETKNQTTRKNKRDKSYDDGNSIATKNVYLVVAGKKNDKIYKLKANKTFKDKPKDVRFDNKTYPSKMEKKKRSLNLEEKFDEHKCPDVNCLCRCPKDDLDLYLEDEHPTGSSRVRIIGRIGLNEDDKYVMKCAATVNGQPVRTNYVPCHIATPGMTERINDARRDTNTEKSRIHINFSDDQLFEPTNGSTTTQATQVDASVQLRKLCPTTDRNTQCNLCELCYTTEISHVGDESKPSNLNRSTSPLVVISVYPKPELKTFEINDNTSMNRFDTQHYRSPQLHETGRVNNFAVNTELYNVRDFSPNKVNISRCCPCETVINNDTTTVTDDTKATNTNKTRTNRTSRSVSPAKKSLKSKTQERKKDFADTSTAKPKSRSPSPNRLNPNDKINQRDTIFPQQTKKVGTLPKRTDIRKQQNETLRSKSKAHDKSFNTVKEQTDKLTKGVTEKQRKNTPKNKVVKHDDKPTRRETVLKKYLPKNEISTVSINIDSEREFYDVVFEKGNFSTDLIVRRTAKDDSQKYFEEAFERNYEKNAERPSDSLENFFLIPGTGQHRRSASQTFNNENTDVFSPNMSRLNVRDSLEIGHRRDHSKDSKSRGSKHRFGNDTDGVNENKLYAPTKHFPGDDCIIDPVERDKEIRELLGIEKKRTDKKHIVDILERNTYRNNSISRRCIFDNTLCKSLAKKPILHWSYSSCAENYLNDNNINIPTRDEEKSITDDEKHKLKKLCTCTKIKKRNVSIQNKVKIAVMTKPESTQYIAQDIMFNQQRSNKDISLQPRQKHKNILLSRKQYRKVKKLMHKVNGDCRKGRHVWNSSIVSLGSVRAKRRSEYQIYYNKDVQTDSHLKNLVIPQTKTRDMNNAGDNHTVVLYCKEESGKVKLRTRNENNENRVRKIPSSIEIRYTSIAYSNRAEYSLESNGSNLIWKRPDSIETIFRGHKKSFTPNLGTSSISLLSDEVKSTESLPTDSKPRKPFLRRLMSCLVMRSQTAAVKVPIVKPKPPTLDSSVDSYHISTSLGAMDMSSSMYDTSVSFYSNHTIGAINNKNKRGFFNSVREFLSPKKN